MNDSPTDQLQEMLAHKAAEKLQWSYTNREYRTRENDASTEEQRNILQKLITRNLVTKCKADGENQRGDTYYIAGSLLETKIPRVQQARKERNNQLIIKRCEEYAKQDGFNSIRDWVVANVGYTIVNDDVCISRKEADRGHNKEMLGALDMTANDLTLLSYRTSYEGMKYIASGDLDKEFLEKGTSITQREIAQKVHTIDVRKSTSEVTSSERTAEAPVDINKKLIENVANDPLIPWDVSFGRISVNWSSLQPEQISKLKVLSKRKIDGENIITIRQEPRGSYFDAGSLLGAIVKEQLDRERAEIKEEIDRAEAVAQKDGYASLVEWVAANIPFKKGSSFTCNGSELDDNQNSMAIALIAKDQRSLSIFHENDDIIFIAEGKLHDALREKELAQKQPLVSGSDQREPAKLYEFPKLGKTTGS